MELKLFPLEKRHALAILGWQYPPPYDIYNFRKDNHQADLSYLLDPENTFFAILNQNQTLVGYCSFGADGQVAGGDYSAQALDIGMGIRPDLVGQGQGKRYALAVVRHGVQHYQTNWLRVTIAAFNLRAQRLWQSLGFEPVERFYKTNSREKFIVLSGTAKEHLE